MTRRATRRKRGDPPPWLPDAARLRDEQGLYATAISRQIGQPVDQVRYWLGSYPKGRPVPKVAAKPQRRPPEPWHERVPVPPVALVAGWRDMTESERAYVLAENPHFEDTLRRMNPKGW